MGSATCSQFGVYESPVQQHLAHHVDARAAGEWLVLHTKSRQEKAVANYLRQKDVEHFLPLMPQVRYQGKRKHRVELPLFPGYVFLRGTRDDAYETDRTRRLVHIIEVVDQGLLDWELRNLREALRHQASLKAHPCLREGVRVEVRSGPMRGLQGIIQNRTQQDRLILQIETLGQAVCMEIEGSLLDPLE